MEHQAKPIRTHAIISQNGQTPKILPSAGNAATKPGLPGLGLLGILKNVNHRPPGVATVLLGLFACYRKFHNAVVTCNVHMLMFCDHEGRCVCARVGVESPESKGISRGHPSHHWWMATEEANDESCKRTCELLTSDMARWLSHKPPLPT